MSTKYLDYDGLLYFWQKIKTIFAPIASPTFTGTPTGPTATAGDSSTQLATTAFVSNAVSSHTAGVSGVKGNAESTYRTGNVNLTPANIGAAPTAHASTATTYGKGTDGNYGHVKLSDSIGSTAAAASGGTAATPKAVNNAVSHIIDEYNLDSLNYFSKIKVNSIDIEGDTQGDTLEFVAGSNVTLTPDATNDKITIAATDTTYSDFTGAASSAAGAHGLVPAPASGYQNRILFGDGTWDTIGYTVGVNSGNAPVYVVHRSSAYTTQTKLFEITIPTAAAVVNSGNGLMSGQDKIKLDSIAMTNGIIDSSVLPSFVDDVIEAYPRANQTELGSTWLATGSASGTVITPETGKIYVLMADSTSYAANTQFRWGGTAYVKLADGGVSSITNAEIDVIVAS